MWLTGVFVTLVASMGILVMLVPQQAPPAVVSGVIAIHENNTVRVSKTVRMVNYTSGRVGYFIAHTNGTDEEEDSDLHYASNIGCCKFLGDRAHWKTRDEPYTVYQGGTLNTIMGRAAVRWRDANRGINIFGQQVVSSLAMTNEQFSGHGQPNAVGWSVIDWPEGSGTILGVTYVEYETAAKQHIVRFGIAFNIDANLCDAAHDANCYDTESVAMHESGHALGLADLYTSACSTALMYGYIARGDTRDRNIPLYDQLCIQDLYDNLPATGEDSASDDPESASTRAAALSWVPLAAITYVL